MDSSESSRRKRRWIIGLVAGAMALVVVGLGVYRLPQFGEQEVPSNPIAARMRDGVLELVFVGQCETFDVSDFWVRVGRGQNFDSADVLDLPTGLDSVQNPVTLRLSGSDVDVNDYEWLVAFGYVTPGSASGAVEESLRHKSDVVVSKLSEGSVPAGLANHEFDELARACPD